MKQIFLYKYNVPHNVDDHVFQFLTSMPTRQQKTAKGKVLNYQFSPTYEIINERNPLLVSAVQTSVVVDILRTSFNVVKVNYLISLPSLEYYLITVSLDILLIWAI